MSKLLDHLIEAHDHLHARTRALIDDNRVLAATHAEEAHEAVHRAMILAALPVTAERDRVCRVFDWHLAGIEVDDDVRARINAFVRDLASGADPTRPV